MAGQFAVPFHFAVEFLVLVVAIGAAIDAVRARRRGAGGWAVGQALGFFSLASAQVVHGGLVRPEDADAVVLALRVAGFAILALVARPQAGIAAKPLVPLMAGGAFPALVFPGPYATYAFIPGVAALVVAARGARAHRADQDPATFAFAAAFVAFAAAEGATAFAPADGGGMLLAAHGLRALAALFLARWLSTSIVGSVRMRFVASFVVLLTLAVLVVSAALNVVIAGTLEREELKRLGEAGEARVTQFRALGESAIPTAKAFAPVAAIVNVVDDRAQRGTDPAAREQEASNLAGQVLRIAPSNAGFVLLVNDDQRVIGSAESVRGRLHRLQRTEALLLGGHQVITEALRCPTCLATSAAKTDALGPDGEVEPQIVVLSAHASADGSRVVGAVVVGIRIDPAFMRGVRADTSAEASIIVDGRVSSTTFVDPPALQAAISSLPGYDDATAGGLDRVLQIGGEDYLTVFEPARAADGQILGQIALSRRGTALEAAQRGMTRTLFLIALLAIVVAALLAWLSGGRFTRPIRSLTGAARELQAGNYEARAKAESADEVGVLGGAFNEMAEELQRKTTDLRQAATSEASLRARMEAIVQSMGDGLIATDAEGRIVTFNRAAEAMMGTRADRALGRAIGDVLTGTTSGGRRLAEAALTGRSADGLLHRGGKTAPLAIAMTSAPLQDSRGQTVGRVVLVRDVSREYEAERMKSEFLSNVSHELRTPITPIKGYAEILKRKKFPRAKTEQFLNGVLESTERLERIVEILVDFASMEAGRLKPRAHPIEVDHLLDVVAERWSHRAARHRFVRKVDRGIPPVLGDEKLLDRSLNELIDNAVKFSPDGGQIEMTAEVHGNGSRRRGNRIKITIRDHGIGIEPDQVPALFQDFRQLDGSETRSYGGLGLGLAYVKRIANVHGGEVEVESQPGRGSAFSLVLPAAEGQRKAMDLPERLTPTSRQPIRAATAPPRLPTRTHAATPKPARKTTARKPVPRKAASRKPARTTRTVGRATTAKRTPARKRAAAKPVRKTPRRKR